MEIRKAIERESLPQVIVQFLHPFHSSKKAAFLQLEAFPCSSTDKRPCLPLVVALAACRALTGAPSSSFLATKSKTPIQDEFIYEREYYFHATLDNENYPLYYNFSLWTPPLRSEVPSEWFLPNYPAQDVDEDIHPEWSAGLQLSSRHSEVSTFIRTIDPRCVLSGHAFCTETAHIVPKSECQWYEKNNVLNQLRPSRIIVGCYESGPQNLINDPRNYLTHDAGINRVFELPLMFYYPFGDDFVAFFYKGFSTYSMDYHCRKAIIPHRVDPYLLYVRFVWSIFCYSTRNRSFSFHALPPGKTDQDRTSSITDASASDEDSNRERSENSGSMDGSDIDIMGVDQNGDVRGTRLEASSIAANHANLDQLFELAEAQGVAFAPEFGDEMNYHPDLSRIEAVRSQYLESNPQVRMTSGSYPRPEDE